MKPEASPDHFAISPALQAEVKAAAAQEDRPVADVLRDLVEQGLAERRAWRAHAERERQRSMELGIHDPADDEPMTEQSRQSIREKIAQGLQSLREGKGTDGGAFFAEMYAELDELERQARE
jgi:hypothetical protein